MSNIITLSDQVDSLVIENQNLRVKSENDDKTIHLMKEQYDSLAATIGAIRQRAATDVAKMRAQLEETTSDLTIERDQAVRSKKEIETLLLQVTNLVMQALRARVGNEVAAEPESDVSADRLPKVGLV